MARKLFKGLAGVMALNIAVAASADVITVNVFNFEFSTGSPQDPVVDAVISVGDTVRWVFLDPMHTTTSVAGMPEQWDSGLVAPGGEFEHTFTTAGTFEYYCARHGFDMGNGHAGGMAGVITVEPALCAADINEDGIVSSADITAFLGLWFADLADGTTNADFDNSGGTTSADITAFLTGWFDGLDGC